MSTTTFITKQHVKYYLKVMRNGSRDDTTDTFGTGKDDFWQYEQTPRAITK
jgi:hypothetical protein